MQKKPAIRPRGMFLQFVQIEKIRHVLIHDGLATRINIPGKLHR